jgi:hypothetical protein
MLSILLVWFLAALISVYWGGFLYRKIPFSGAESHSVSWFISFWVGLVLLNSVLNVWCFFFPLYPGVKAVFWIFLLLVPCIQGIRSWKFFSEELLKKINQIQPLAWIPVLFTAGLALLKSSGRPEIFDEGAYHLPLIRMWETKGLVAGVANLNGHYGLHSGWHILSAFCNLDFIPGWKLTLALNGLVAAVLSLASGLSISRIIRKEGGFSDWILAFMPFFLFRNMLSSPSTDIPAIVAIWFVLAFWLNAVEKNISHWKIWPVFLLIPVWVFTIKASSAAILLVPAGLLVLAIFEKSRRKILWIPVVCLLLILPWCIQNWLISGYLVFPLESTAFLSPEWQVPGYFIQKKFYPEQFGAFAPPSQYNLEWLRSWFMAHNPDTRIILIMSVVSILMIPFILSVFPKYSRKRFLFLCAVLLASLLGWFFTVTEPRYGFGALVFSALMPVALAGKWVSDIRPYTRFGVLVLAVLQGFMFLKTVKEIPSGTISLFSPTERPKVAYRRIQLKNFKASFPVTYLSAVPLNKPVFCWDCPFPCFPKESRDDSAFIERDFISGKEIYKSIVPVKSKISD